MAMLPSLTRLSIGCDATDTAADPAGGKYVEKTFALTSNGFAKFRECIINNSENIEEYGTKVCYVSSVCNAEEQDQSRKEITVRFYFDLDKPSNFKNDYDSETKAVTYKEAFHKVVKAFKKHNDTDPTGAANFARRDVLFDTVEGHSLTMRTSNSTRIYDNNKAKNTIFRGKVTIKYIRDHLAEQLHELFLTLAVNCILSSGSDTFRGAFVEVWELSSIENFKDWKNGPFFAVTMISETQIPMSIIDREHQIEAASALLDLTKQASNANVILMDNKMGNALCRQEEATSCYLIDFDPQHTTVLSPNEEGGEDYDFSVALCSLINSAVLLLQLNMEMDPSYFTEEVNNAEQYFMDSLETFAENESYIKMAESLFSFLLLTNENTLSAIKSGGSYCGMPIVRDNYDSLEIAYDDQMEAETTIAFSYDPTQFIVQACVAQRMIFNLSYYSQFYKYKGLANPTTAKTANQTWLSYYVKVLLMKTNSKQKTKMIKKIDYINSVLYPDNINKIEESPK